MTQATTAEMTTTTTTTELATSDRLKLATTGLEPESATSLRAAFETMFAQADEWAARARTINVTSVDQKREMKLARDSRLALREIRVRAEHARKKLKEDSSRKGKAIDGIANVLKALIEPLEEHLLEQETFADRIEEKQRTELAAARADALRAYGSDPSVFVNLGEMLEETWILTIAGASAAHEARLEAARHDERVKLEAEKIAAENREKSRLERTRLEAERVAKEKAQTEEVERLRLEAVEREAVAARELASVKAEAEAEAARVAAVHEAERQAAERETRRKHEEDTAARSAAKEESDRKLAALAEETRKAKEETDKAARELAQSRAAAETARLEAEAATLEREAAERAVLQAAELAPDREKILAFAASVRAIPRPALTTERGAKAAAALETQLEKLAAWIDKTAAAL